MSSLRRRRSTTRVLTRRFIAAMIDTPIVVIVYSLMLVELGHAGPRAISPAGALLFAAVGLAYFFAFETLFAATPGKRLCGLRVVSFDGGRPTPGAIVKRTLWRLIDQTPLALLTMRRSWLRQRNGDRSSGTLVVGD